MNDFILNHVLSRIVYYPPPKIGANTRREVGKDKGEKKHKERELYSKKKYTQCRSTNKRTNERTTKRAVSTGIGIAFVLFFVVYYCC